MIIMAKKPVIAILIPKLTDTKSFDELIRKLGNNYSVLFFYFDNLRKDKKPRRQDIKSFIATWPRLHCLLIPCNDPLPGYWDGIMPGLTTYYELSRLRNLPIVFFKFSNCTDQDDHVLLTFQDSVNHINNLIKEIHVRK